MQRILEFSTQQLLAMEWREKESKTSFLACERQLQDAKGVSSVKDEEIQELSKILFTFQGERLHYEKQLGDLGEHIELLRIRLEEANSLVSASHANENAMRAQIQDLQYLLRNSCAQIGELEEMVRQREEQIALLEILVQNCTCAS